MCLRPLLVAAMLTAGLVQGVPAQAEAGLGVTTVPAFDRWDGREVRVVAASEQGLLLEEEGLGCTWYPTGGQPVAADCDGQSVHAFGTLLVSDEQRGSEAPVLRTPGARRRVAAL